MSDLSRLRYDELTAEDGPVSEDDAGSCEICGEVARNQRQILRQDGRGTWQGTAQFMFACAAHVPNVETLANTPEPWG